MKAIDTSPRGSTPAGSSQTPLKLNVKRDTSSKKSRVQRSASSLQPQMKQTMLSRNSKKSGYSRSQQSSEERATRLSKMIDPEGAAVTPIEEVKEGEQIQKADNVKHFTYQLKSQNKQQSILPKEINLEPRFGPPKKESSPPPLSRLTSLIPLDSPPRPYNQSNSNLQFKIPVQNRPSSAAVNYVPNTFDFPKIPTSQSVTYIRPVHTVTNIDLPARNTVVDYRARQPVFYQANPLNCTPCIINHSINSVPGQLRTSPSPTARFSSHPYVLPTRVLSQPNNSYYREPVNNLIVQQPIVLNSANFQRPVLSVSPRQQHQPIYLSSTPSFAVRPHPQTTTPPFLSSLEAGSVKPQFMQQQKMLIKDQTPVFNPSKQQALSPIPVKLNSQSYSMSTPEGQPKSYPIYDLTQLNQRIRNYTQAQDHQSAQSNQVLSKDKYVKKAVQTPAPSSPQRQSVSEAMRQAEEFQRAQTREFQPKITRVQSREFQPKITRVQSREFQPKISPEPYYSRLISQPPKGKDSFRDMDRHLNNQPYRKTSPSSRGHVHVRRQPGDICVSRVSPSCRYIPPPESHKLIELQLMREQLQSQIFRLKRSSRFIVKEGMRPCSPVPCDY